MRSAFSDLDNSNFDGVKNRQSFYRNSYVAVPWLRDDLIHPDEGFTSLLLDEFCGKILTTKKATNA
jgi:hypothetical protein